MSRLLQCVTVLAVLIISHGVTLGQQNHFASIYLDGKKIGQVHFTLRHDEKGLVEELKTRSSVSIFGIKVFYFTQHLHEIWKDGEI